MQPKVHFPAQFPGAVSNAFSSRQTRQGHAWLGPWFFPLAPLYAAALWLRHKAFDWGFLHSECGALPTLVVGNLELGGTGKTPHAMDLAKRLESRLGTGTVAILSRGHGRSSKQFQWVDEACTWEHVGDEPWMMARSLRSIPVAVGANRLEALRAMAQTRPELKAVVLDDGMQHRALIPDRLVCLQSRPKATWASVLPAGPWRDLPSRRGVADLVVATQPEVQGEVRSRTLAHPPTCVHPTPADAPLERPALLVTGTAQPQRVVASAVHLNVALAACAHYPDHHPYSAQDIEAWHAYGQVHGVQDLVTTAKDAARLDPWLPQLAAWRIWILPLEVHWEDQDAVNAFINSWVRTLPS